MKTLMAIIFALSATVGAIADEYPYFSDGVYQHTLVTDWIEDWGNAGETDFPDAYGFNTGEGDYPPDDQMNWVSQLVQLDYWIPFGGEESGAWRPWNWPSLNGYSGGNWKTMLDDSFGWQRFFFDNQNQQAFPATHPDWPNTFITTMNGNYEFDDYQQDYIWNGFNSTEQDYGTTWHWALDGFLAYPNTLTRSLERHRITVGSILLVTEDRDANDGFLIYAEGYEQPAAEYSGHFDAHCRVLSTGNPDQPGESIDFHELIGGLNLGDISNYRVYVVRNEASAAR